MEQIKSENILLCNFFENYVKNLNNPNVLFCALEGIEEVFEKCKKNPSERYVIVSAYSDFGLVEQEKEHPNFDIRKHFYMVDWRSIEVVDHYRAVKLGPTFQPLKCQPNHRYAVKIYAFTNFTFDEVPENIDKWFCVNANIQHDKIVNVPLGMSEYGDGWKNISSHFKHFNDKKKLLYLNFQNNTVERVELKSFYKNVIRRTPGLENYVTIREDYIDHDVYTEEMSEHKFVLCPRGNGMDTYRWLESLYVGSIPVVEDNYMNRVFANQVPVVVTDNLFAMSLDMLSQLEANVSKIYDNCNLSILTNKYWKNVLDTYIPKEILT